MPRPALAPIAALIALAALILAGGCASSVVPQALMEQVDQNLTLEKVQMVPGKYLNQSVLWGGRVLKVVNRPKGTLIEVLQIPLDSDLRPKEDAGSSQGRFVVSMEGFLDPAVYARGRAVTVVGQVAGSVNAPVGQYKYTFVYLRGQEVKLWPRLYPQPMPDVSFGLGVEFDPDYPPPYWGGPFYPWW